MAEHVIASQTERVKFHALPFVRASLDNSNAKQLSLGAQDTIRAHERGEGVGVGCASQNYLTPVCAGITAVQLIGTTVWLIIEPPDTTEIHPYPLSAVLTCRVSTFSLMMSLVYNMFLILMCTLYAFKTRKIPEDFNEAKYIGFTMYSTCIVWLAFVPIYFGTNNDYKVCDEPRRRETTRVPITMRASRRVFLC